MFLGNLLGSVRKKYRKISIEGICFDSRKVKKKDIFFAIKGNQTSGTKFIEDAISKGASAIVSNEKIKYKNDRIPLVLVKDARKSLSETCSKFYKQKPTKIIAVTGTNGKSSVAYFFYQILNLNKISAASIGTLGIISKKYNKKINTFVSLFPTSKPKYVLLVMLDEPQAAPGYIYEFPNGYKHKGEQRNTSGWNTVVVAGKIIEKIGPILAINNLQASKKF